MALPAVHAKRETDINTVRATDELAEKQEQKQTKQHVDTERQREIERRVVSHLGACSTALTVAQASSIRQTDSNETSSTPSRTLLPSFNQTVIRIHLHCVCIAFRNTARKTARNIQTLDRVKEKSKTKSIVK